MARCAGTKGNGEHCRGIAATGSDYCPAHDPNRQEARHHAASKAAKSKRGKGVRDVLYDQARKLYERVERGEIDPKVGTVLVQAMNAQTRILELQRRVEPPGVLTPEQFDDQISTVVDVITRTVTDGETIEAIACELDEYLGKSR